MLLALMVAGVAEAGVYQGAPAGEDFGRLSVNWKPLAEDCARAARSWKLFKEANKNTPASARKLRVVYVTFKDRPALPNYRERYDRIMKNVQAYYADQMQANGYPALTFDLELDAQGKVVVHDAYVDKNMEEVGIRSSGDVARDAARAVLAQKGIDINNEHVLIVCQLPDGVGPYYGYGRSHAGIAYVCDQHDLDPRNFHDTADMKEARYPMTRGRNTTVYVGGITHELGHAFGLPHTGFNWGYDNDSGRSLMGDGNHRYGEEKRGEGAGAYLAPADAMKLASLPLFSGVETTLAPDAGAGDYCGTYAPSKLENVVLTPVKDGVHVKGKVSTERSPYGVTVYFDPPEDDPYVEYDGDRFLRPRGWCDYDTSAATAMMSANGEFEAIIRRPDYKKNEIELRITVLHSDGSRGIHFIPMKVTPEGMEKK